jgi:hypothetical protein
VDPRETAGELFADAAAERPQRDGGGELERRALRQYELCLPSLPARRLVHDILWPSTVQDFARWADVSVPHASHCLSGGNDRRPYEWHRACYAQRFSGEGITLVDIQDVIERARWPLGMLDDAAKWIGWDAEPVKERELFRAPPLDLSRMEACPRDGLGEVEQLALRRVRANIASYPPGEVLSILCWPYILREVAARTGVGAQDLTNMLSFVNGLRFPMRRLAACRVLQVEPEDLEHLIEATSPPGVELPVVASPAELGMVKRRGIRRRRKRKPE